MSLDFLLTSLVFVVTPGTGVLYTVATGLSHGRRAAVIAAIGCTLGIVPHLAAAAVGLSALLHAGALAFQTLKYCGVVYLLYLAWVTVKEQRTLDAAATRQGRRSAGFLIGRAILINLLNPKLTLFFFAFLPQFIAPSQEHAFTSTLKLGVAFMLLTLVVFIAYGMLAAAASQHLLSRPKLLVWLRRTFAAMFVALGVRLAVEHR